MADCIRRMKIYFMRRENDVLNHSWEGETRVQSHIARIFIKHTFIVRTSVYTTYLSYLYVYSREILFDEILGKF